MLRKKKPPLTVPICKSIGIQRISLRRDRDVGFHNGRALGVDVEQLRDNFDHDAIARRFFSEEEQRQLAALAPPERYYGFFRCWTRKEAYIKAQGTGLSLPLHQF